MPTLPIHGQQVIVAQVLSEIRSRVQDRALMCEIAPCKHLNAFTCLTSVHLPPATGQFSH